MVNPMIINGHGYGAVARGIGAALYGHLIYLVPSFYIRVTRIEQVLAVTPKGLLLILALMVRFVSALAKLTINLIRNRDKNYL